MPRLFISQQRLDEWVEQQRVRLEGKQMTLEDDGRVFQLEEGVFFAEVVGGEAGERVGACGADNTGNGRWFVAARALVVDAPGAPLSPTPVVVPATAGVVVLDADKGECIALCVGLV